MNLNKYINDIYTANVAAGWWSDIETGQQKALTVEFVLSKVALIHSELTEAFDGMVVGCNDDHLPQYPMFLVELADAFIRTCDLMGALKMKPLPTMVTSQGSLLWCHRYASDFLEAYRKGQTKHEQEQALSNLIACIRSAYINETGHDNFAEIVDAKLAYNAQRADHKVENRLKSGGKKL